MAVQLTSRPEAETTRDAGRRNGRTLAALAIVAGVLALVFVAVNARTGAVAERIKNPAVTGAPRPVEPLFGFDGWITLHQVGTVAMMVTLVVAFVIAWRRHPAHPVLLMVLATTLLVWQDPIMNWAPYAVYNPELWHWPETWALVSLSPTVEPFIVIGYATFYMAPFFPAVLLLRRAQSGLVRVAASADLPGQPDPGDRLRVRHDSRGVAGPHRDVHLLAGHSVRHDLRRYDTPVPAAVGVAVGDVRDDSRRCADLSR